jgi:glycosyltransferase involved in cell wall biosynthesis
MSVCMHVMRDTADDVRLRRSATTLGQAGWQVTIVDVIGASGHMPNNSSPLPQVAPYAIQHVPTSSDFQSQRFAGMRRLQILLLVLRATMAVLKQSADVYHACEWTALPACYIAALIHHKPLIFEAYELPLQDHALAALSKGRRRLYTWMQLFLTYTLPRCAAVITVSPPIVHEIQSRYHIPHVTLLRNISNYQATTKTPILREYLQLSAQTRIALYQGNLQPDRGLDRLVLAAAYLEPECMLVIMGKNIGTTQAELEALITLQHAGNYVKIIPAVPYDTLSTWTASADIGLTILPLDYSENMKMCLPNKLFEYIQAGLPVLSSPLPAVQEILNTYNVGKVISSLHPAAIGTAINTMLNDSTALKRMHDNALQAAHQDLCWEKESQYLIRLYQQVMPIFSSA